MLVIFKLIIYTLCRNITSFSVPKDTLEISKGAFHQNNNNINIQIYHFLNLNGVFKILPVRYCLKADLILGPATVELG